MASATPELLAYYESGKPLYCELVAEPYLCDFWPREELNKLNADYQVPVYAPGFFGFATSGGGEMFALAPTGAVVCLPFVGMEPDVALPVAGSWQDFERMLRTAP